MLHGNNGQNTTGDLYGTSSTSVSEDVNANTPPVASNVVLTPQVRTSDDVVVSYTYSDDDNDGESRTPLLAPQRCRAGGPHIGHPALLCHHQGRFVACRGDTFRRRRRRYARCLQCCCHRKLSPRSHLSITLTSEAPDTNDDVTFSVVLDDDDGDAVTSTEIRWLLDGAPVSSLENATTLPALATRAGDQWTVEIRVSDGDDISDWFTSPTATVGSSNQAPTVSDLVLSPAEPTTVDDITATWVASDPDGDAIVDTEILVQERHPPTRSGRFESFRTVSPQKEKHGRRGSVFRRNAWSFIPSSAELSILNAAPVAELRS